MGGWVDGWVDRWVDGWVDGSMGGWIDGWNDGRVGVAECGPKLIRLRSGTSVKTAKYFRVLR